MMHPRKPRMVVTAQELCRREFTVSSIFNAIHIVACQAMPRGRSLGEYLAVLNPLGKLVARLFEHLVVHCAFPISFVSSSISLLVVCRFRDFLEEDQPLARASICFSLTGYKRNRPKLIRERKSNFADVTINHHES